MKSMEEIIINDVEVEGCKYYRKKDKNCDVWGIPCSMKEDCFFRQLQRLKKKYDEVLTLAKQNADSNEYCLQELEKENEGLRQALEIKNVTIMIGNKCYSLHDLHILFSDAYFNGLTAEQIIDSAKKSLELLDKIYELKKENEELKEKNIELQIVLNEINRFNNYRHTLEEIKGYLKTLSSIDNDFVNTETYLRINEAINEVLR